VFGASISELSFVAVLVVIVLLSQVAPRVGEAIGARLAPEGPADRPKAEDEPPG
jgi:hypothetical protein